MPIIIDHNVFLSIEDIVLTGIAQRTVYYDIKMSNIKTYQYEEHGKLIDFNSLKYSWKQQINAFYDGCVKVYTQFKNIETALRRKTQDRAILDTYRLPCGNYLSKAKRIMYEKCCALLALLERLFPVTDGKVSDFGAATTKEFWQVIYSYIEKKGLKLPKSRRLKTVLKKYMKEGATAIISKKFGNKNSCKIGELERDLIIALYSDAFGRKFTKKQVYEQFIYLAKEKGWEHCKNVTYQAVADILSKSRGEWLAERHGEKHFKLNHSLVINRNRASQPNLVWQLDGTPECLWYYDPKRKTIDKLYVMKVMDSHSWKIVGHSIGYTETSNLVFEAIKMACTTYQVKPKEVRSDKGSAMQAAETKELMQNLGAVFFPTATGNARAKSVEAWQNLFNQQVLTYFKNKSGANITANTLDSRQNPDKIKKFAKTYPTKEELIGQIHLAMHLYNATPDSKGKTPNEKHQKQAPDVQQLGIMEQLELFYIWRKKGKKLVPYRFGFQGLTIELQGNKFRYLPELEANDLANFMNEHTNVSIFYVKYDPSDVTQIGMYQLPKGQELTTDNLRFVCDAKLKGKTAETSHDATEPQKQLLAKYQKVQKLQLNNTKVSMDKRRQRLQDENVLNGAIELSQVHKDRLNEAQIALERQQALGFDNTIMSDKNKELSAISLEGEQLFDLSIDEDDDAQPLDVYG